MQQFRLSCYLLIAIGVNWNFFGSSNGRAAMTLRSFPATKQKDTLLQAGKIHSTVSGRGSKCFMCALCCHVYFFCCSTRTPHGHTHFFLTGNSCRHCSGCDLVYIKPLLRETSTRCLIRDMRIGSNMHSLPGTRVAMKSVRCRAIPL